MTAAVLIHVGRRSRTARPDQHPRTETAAMTLAVSRPDPVARRPPGALGRTAFAFTSFSSRETTMTVMIHPAAPLAAAVDASGQFWLPPLWLWPEDYRGSWEWQHEPEYLVMTGRASSRAKASVMIVRGMMIAAILAGE
jgi:hypothetical protein